MNLNELAKEITLAEGKKESISIAQIKEVFACLGKRWRELDEDEFQNEALLIRNKAGLR